MKRNGWALALAIACVSQSAWAEDEEKREDPWEYDKEKQAEREAADKEDLPERTFGNAGEIAISAERLLGYASTSWKMKLKGLPDPKDSVSHLNLLVNAGTDERTYSAPRIAFDYFVTNGLSLGGAVGLSATSGDQSYQHFQLNPRVGYNYMFGSVVGVWPRVGMTYQEQKIAGAKIALLAVSVDVALVIVPLEHVALTLGPTFDGGIVGKINPEGPQTKTDYAQDEFGFQSGLTVFF